MIRGLVFVYRLKLLKMSMNVKRTESGQRDSGDSDLETERNCARMNEIVLCGVNLVKPKEVRVC